MQNTLWIYIEKKMKSFNEIIEEKNENSQSYRLVVLVERPKKLDPKGTSSKLVSKAEKLGIETYTRGVQELPENRPGETLKAQAIATRTFITNKILS